MTFLCLSLTYVPVYSQIDITPSNQTDRKGDVLIKNTFRNNSFRSLDVQLIGSKASVGVFENGIRDIGIDRGLVFSTGQVTSLSQANDGSDAQASSITPDDFLGEDPDLQRLTDSSIEEVSGLKMTVIPREDRIEFRYVFGSEEYPEFNCAVNNDVLGIFITGPNPNGPDYVAQNIALVPDPADPSGATFTNFPVWTNSVNSGIAGTRTTEICDGPSESLGFSQYYNDNTGGQNIKLNGYLDVFRAIAEVVPCAEYTVKIVIANAHDFAFDSAVFLEATPGYTITSNLGIDHELDEACASGTLNIEFDNPVSQQTEVPIGILASSTADASDYSLSSNSFIVPAGQSTASIDISVADDGNTEGDEFLHIVDGNISCAADTLVVPIVDNFFSTAFVEFTDESICVPTTLTDLGLPDKVDRNSRYVTPLDPTQFGTITGAASLRYSFNVDQSGRFSVSQLIEDVCIEGLIHEDLSELSILLRTPEGVYYRLVDIGDLNGAAAVATDICLSDLPNRDELLDEILVEFNGTWELLITDEEINNERGSVDRVQLSIFNPDFLDYTITTSMGVPVDGSFVVGSDESFTIDAVDIDGCTHQEVVNIDFNDDLAEPDDLSCTEIARDQLEFSWSHPEPNARFEIQIEGMEEWVSIGTDRSYIVRDLLSDQTVMFSVRTIAATCISAQVNLLCGTSQCIAPDLNIVRRANNTSACEPNGLVELGSLTTKGPYRYFLDNEEFSDATITDLDEGSYTARVIDGFGCEATIDFVIDGIPGLEVELEVFNAFCGLEGFADAIPTGGNPPYQFAWSNGSDEATASQLVAGEYTVAVTDASGCMYRDTFTIDASDALTIAIDDLVNVDCNGEATGEIAFSLAGGITPFDMEIRDAQDSLVVMVPSGDLRVRDLRAGSYTLYISDRFNCANQMDFEIVEPQPLIVNATSSNANCNFELNGRIELAIDGGSGNYNVDWSTGDTGPVLGQIAGGTYTYTVSDDRGCFISGETTIENESFVEFSLSSQDLGCSNINDGSINISEVTGTIESIDWSHGATELILTDLAPDEYCATIVFVGGCTLDTCVTILAPIPVSTDMNVVDNVCFGESDGSVTLDISDGVGPYMIELNGASFTTDNSITIDSLAADTYDVLIVDSRGCGDNIQVVVAAANDLQIAEQVINNDCKGDVAGSISLSLTGVGAVTDVVWTSADQIVRRGESITNLPTGDYQAEIMTAAGCSFTHTVTITEPDDALSGTATVTDAVCHGEESGIININRAGGTGPAMYILDRASPTSEPRFESLRAGSYDVEIIDESECRFLIPDIIVGEPDTFTLMLATDTSTFELQDVDVAVEITGAQGDYDLFWESDPADLIPCAACDSFTFQMIDRSIVVAVEAVDDKGCVAYDEQRIFVQRANHVEIPTAFTPNGDGVNDFLDVFGTPNTLITEFTVYDRNGVMLYIGRNMDTNSELNGWDGTYRGELMPAGPYIWTVAAVFPDGREDKYSGSTHLLR